MLWDLVILGSGFAGSLMAMIARSKGYRTLILEKHQHPRIVIGESTTPLTNLLLDEISREYKLECLQGLTRWSRWKQDHPELRVGLKRGFTFHAIPDKASAQHPGSWKKELLVAASPNNDLADTHWWREDFDAYLLEQAVDAGADYWDHSEVTEWVEQPEHITMGVQRPTGASEIQASWVVDASGGASAIASLCQIPLQPLEVTPPTHSAYSHFTDLKCPPADQATSPSNKPPYPSHQAAVHYLIPGGWIWMLHFDHGTTSAGVVFDQAAYPQLQGTSAEGMWQHALNLAGPLGPVVAQANAIYPMRKRCPVGFRYNRIKGDRWIMLPSAAGFVDPLLSTGFPMTLLGIQRLAKSLPEVGALRQGEKPANWDQIATLNQNELKMSDQLIGTLYACMGQFEMFAATTLIYFAAVSYAETVRRLNQPHLAPGFLFSQDPERSGTLSQTLSAIRKMATSSLTLAERSHRIRQWVAETIEPINVAGLDPWKPQAWFPATVEPLLDNAHKCQVSRQAMQAMLIKEGMLAPDAF